MHPGYRLSWLYVAQIVLASQQTLPEFELLTRTQSAQERRLSTPCSHLETVQ